MKSGGEVFGSFSAGLKESFSPSPSNKVFCHESKPSWLNWMLWMPFASVRVAGVWPSTTLSTEIAALEGVDSNWTVLGPVAVVTLLFSGNSGRFLTGARLSSCRMAIGSVTLRRGIGSGNLLLQGWRDLLRHAANRRADPGAQRADCTGGDAVFHHPLPRQARWAEAQSCSQSKAPTKSKRFHGDSPVPSGPLSMWPNLHGYNRYWARTFLNFSTPSCQSYQMREGL